MLNLNTLLTETQTWKHLTSVHCRYLLNKTPKMNEVKKSREKTQTMGYLITEKNFFGFLAFVAWLSDAPPATVDFFFFSKIMFDLFCVLWKAVATLTTLWKKYNSFFISSTVIILGRDTWTRQNGKYRRINKETNKNLRHIAR